MTQALTHRLPHGLTHRQRWLALMVVCLGVLMIVLDVTIVNVALPSIKADLGFTETSLVWVVNAYMLTFGGFLLLGGRLGDLFGHRRLFLIGIFAFTAASVVCGLATSQAWLVGARAVQGLGGAAVGLALFARAPVNGGFWWDVLPGMLLLGLGAGIAFNPVLLAAMNDVAPYESGLASGIVNTSFMMGGALGLAVLASLAAARTDALAAAGLSAQAALNGGYQWAFIAGAVFAAVAAVLATFLLDSDR